MAALAALLICAADAVPVTRQQLRNGSACSQTGLSALLQADFDDPDPPHPWDPGGKLQIDPGCGPPYPPPSPPASPFSPICFQSLDYVDHKCDIVERCLKCDPDDPENECEMRDIWGGADQGWIDRSWDHAKINDGGERDSGLRLQPIGALTERTLFRVTRKVVREKEVSYPDLMVVCAVLLSALFLPSTCGRRVVLQMTRHAYLRHRWCTRYTKTGSHR